MAHTPTAPIAAISAADPLASIATPASRVKASGGTSFAQMMIGGVDQVNQKLVDADALVQQFALSDAVPPHQVAYALEQARLSVQLMMQVRSHLIEGYQDIMRMQL